MKPVRKVLAALLLGGCGGTGDGARELTVFAASSLTDVLGEAAKDFPAAGLSPNFGGSNALAQQIRFGAPADLFLSASAEPVDELVSAGLADASTRRRLAGNLLVIVVPAGEASKVASPETLIEAKRIAIGDPGRGVPAGTHARELLKRRGIWDRLSGKLVPSLNVRAALGYVETGRADAAIVYVTDAASSDRVRIVHRFENDAVDVVGIVLTRTKQPDLSKRFLEFLASEEGARILRRHGFLP